MTGPVVKLVDTPDLGSVRWGFKSLPGHLCFFFDRPPRAGGRIYYAARPGGEIGKHGRLKIGYVGVRVPPRSVWRGGPALARPSYLNRQRGRLWHGRCGFKSRRGPAPSCSAARRILRLAARGMPVASNNEKDVRKNDRPA